MSTRPTDFDRRTLIAAAGATLAAAAPLASVAQAATGGGAMPPGFLWGAATAGHQVEGNNLNSDIWLLEHLAQTPFKEPSGDACDQYHLYEQDIAMAASFGLNAYRFSLEWARIEPEEGQFSNAELQHYRDVAAACRKHGLTPVLTYNHFTVPRWFAAQGGWENPRSPDLFARFCERSTAAVGDLIGAASTFNEPNIGRLLLTMLPAGLVAQFPNLMAAAAGSIGAKQFSTIQFAPQDVILPNLIAAHDKAYAVIKAGPGDYPVGLSLAMIDEQPAGPGSMFEQARHDRYGAWLQAVQRTGDFIGVQTYSRGRWDAKGLAGPPPGAELTQMGEEFYPEALEATIRYAHKLTAKPVYVTENGIGTQDDTRRVEYIRRALAGVKRCLADGLPVRGYIHWSLLDNFEWVSGYGPKFGLVAVDRATQKRTPKPSAAYYGAIAKRNSI